jgi:hypothetical protein
VYRQRHRRAWAELPPDELRARLHARLDGNAITPGVWAGSGGGCLG